MRISIAICTFKRRDSLIRLLESIEKCTPAIEFDVTVVDNDPEGSAKWLKKTNFNFLLHYVNETKSGLSFARNRAWSETSSDVILYIDDDQEVSHDFLIKLKDQINILNSKWDGLKLPVQFVFAGDNTYAKPSYFNATKPPKATHKLQRTEMATNGLLMRKNSFGSPPFRPEFNHSGGEDIDVFMRFSHLKWFKLSTPIIKEHVASERLSIQYLKGMWFRKGYCDADLNQRYGNSSLVALTKAFLIWTGCLPLRLNTQAKLLAARQRGKMRRLVCKDQLRFYGDKPINVLHMTQYTKIGGVEKLLLKMSQRGLYENVSPAFFYYNEKGNGTFYAAMKSSSSLVVTHQKSPGIDWQILDKLQKIVRDNNIDLIHTRDLGALFYTFLFHLRNRKVQLVHTVHSTNNWIRTPKWRALHILANTFSHRLICVADHVTVQVKQLPLVFKKNITTIPNGVAATTGQLKPKDNLLKIISISRVSEEKDLNTLIAAYSKLSTGGTPFIASHLGDGPLFQSLQNRIRSYSIDHHFKLLGRVVDSETYLDQADIFVSTSIDEGHPIALLEALASGKICVISDIAAHKDFPEDTVIRFPTQNADALANTLRTILENPDSFYRFGVNAKRFVAATFSFDQMLVRYKKVYSSLLLKNATC